MAGIFENRPVFIIDTPGLEDNRGSDTIHLNQMTQYIKEISSVKAFVFVISFNNYRLDQSVIRLFINGSNVSRKEMVQTYCNCLVKFLQFNARKY